MSEQKIVDYLIDQNRVLLDQALGATISADGGGSVALLEARRELEAANRSAEEARSEYAKVRATLFSERDSNKKRESELRAELKLAESQVASQAQIISEHQARQSQDEQRFEQLQSELDKQRTALPELTGGERDRLTRFMQSAIDEWHEDEERSWQALNRAWLLLTGEENDGEE